MKDVSCSDGGLHAKDCHAVSTAPVPFRMRRARFASHKLVGVALTGSFASSPAPVHIQSSPALLLTWRTFVKRSHCSVPLRTRGSALAARIFALPKLVTIPARSSHHGAVHPHLLGIEQAPRRQQLMPEIQLPQSRPSTRCSRPFQRCCRGGSLPPMASPDCDLSPAVAGFG